MAAPNARWSVYVVHDQLACGRWLRILNVVDDVTKECVVDTSISGRRVARELAALIARRGRPGLIVSDHDTEFPSNAMLEWTQDAEIAWHFIAPGKPQQNGICASFDGRMRDELLNETLSSASVTPAPPSPAGSPTTTTKAALGARSCDPGRLCRPTRRAGRLTPRDRSAPPIAHCSVVPTAPV